ncbi:hypothetical protein PV05_01956 [Exophiala xenobiotica]|uniref:Uncharacterized protein n=1 Tax=Exophiala xenobiotica TaxID=348802 RepID=A0A0D2F4G6_9EURO|nr:uncharacterized protein PV05_01956 [Exophiala xenobiotica]KIW61885.1 hypothetical protein PV05_01956 [Exophiala xenobiotica]
MSEEFGKPVWLITGSSSGLGLALTRYVLSQGHRVIGTSRNPSRIPELVSEVESQGGKWLALDATQPEHEIKNIMRQAESFFEHIDVLVNNAGFCVLGMRKRRSGVIMNVSSTQGLVASHACGVYAASKFALEAISEACRAEVAAFGIQVLIIEPGAFRTDFGSTASGKHIEPSEEYAGDHVVARRLAQIESLPRVARGDPDKAAKVMFEAGTGQGEAGELIQKENILRVILGPDSWKGIDAKINELRRTADLVKDVAASTDL